jgi:hypothetical protein
VLCKPQSSLLLWYVLEKTAVTELKMPSVAVVGISPVVGIFPNAVVAIFNSAVIGIFPSPLLEFFRRRKLEFFCRHHWNFSVAIIGIFPSPSLKFCRCHRWNFAVAVAVVGIFVSAVVGNFKSAVVGIVFHLAFHLILGFQLTVFLVLSSCFPFCRRVSRFVVTFHHCVLPLHFAVVMFVMLVHVFF